jgi:acetylglutamate synthase
MLPQVKPHNFVEDKSLVGNLRYIREQLGQKHEKTCNKGFILKSRVDRLIKQKLMTSSRVHNEKDKLSGYTTQSSLPQLYLVVMQDINDVSDTIDQYSFYLVNFGIQNS